ncbi:MAG: undecaprenyl-diphosphatase UppP [bacterium]|nr:undecaprenyl-diphosphatase UppP [bacterium]
MTFIDALILGIIEGITEFLPISSTGHLMLAGRLLNLAQTEFLKSFDIAIQSGAILAVVVLYARRLWRDAELAKRIVAAFIPTAVVGLALYRTVKDYLLADTGIVLWMLFLGGIGLVVFEKWYVKRTHAFYTSGDEESHTHISYSQALWIGLCQSVAMVPGVSRAAATIIGGLALGIERKTIVEFSFLLAIPTMAAATGLDLIKNAQSFSGAEFYLLAIGFIAAFITALISVLWLLRFIKTHTFTPFGIYRVALALVFWLFI